MNATLSKFLELLAIGAVAAAGLLATAAHAQQVYRIVGPDGKVTFSDKPPPAATAPAKVTNAASGASAGQSGSALPFELRQVASKYPVTLYTSSNCVPCGSARSMLNSRGIPFTERTVNNAADGQALQRISGDFTVPLLTIGGQQLKGYSDAEWTQFLNAAGYPATSMLPAGYRQAAATPLVSVTVAGPPATAAAGSGNQEAERPAPPPIQAAPSNPAGIKF